MTLRTENYPENRNVIDILDKIFLFMWDENMRGSTSFSLQYICQHYKFRISDDTNRRIKPILDYYTKSAEILKQSDLIQLNKEGIEMMGIYGSYKNYIESERVKRELVNSYIRVNNSVEKTNENQRLFSKRTTYIAVITLLALLLQCMLLYLQYTQTKQQEENKKLPYHKCYMKHQYQ